MSSSMLVVNHHHRIIALATLVALVLLVAAVHVTADPDVRSVRQHKQQQQQQQQQYYRGGVRGAKNKQPQNASVTTTTATTNRNLKRGMMGPNNMSDRSKNRMRRMGPNNMNEKSKNRNYKNTDKGRESQSKSKRMTELKTALISSSFVSNSSSNTGVGTFGRFVPSGYHDNSVAATTAVAAAVTAQQEAQEAAKEVQALPSAGYDAWVPTIADDTVVFGRVDHDDNSVAVTAGTPMVLPPVPAAAVPKPGSPAPPPRTFGTTGTGGSCTGDHECLQQHICIASRKGGGICATLGSCYNDQDCHNPNNTGWSSAVVGCVGPATCKGVVCQSECATGSETTMAHNPNGNDDMTIKSGTVAQQEAATTQEVQAQKAHALPSKATNVFAPRIDSARIFGTSKVDNAATTTTTATAASAGYDDNSVAASSSTTVVAPTIDSALIAGRIDNAADTDVTAAAPEEGVASSSSSSLLKTVDDWIQSCGVMSRRITRCASPLADDARVCKNCLKALTSSTTTYSGGKKVTVTVKTAGVAQCAHSPFCGECTSEDLRPFLACGVQVEKGLTTQTTTNAATTTVITTTTDPNGSTTSTTALTAVTDTDPSSTVVVLSEDEQQEPAIDDVSVVVEEKEPVIVVVVDFDDVATPPPTSPPATITRTIVSSPTTTPSDLQQHNCPAIYPRSGTECAVTNGFDYKKCLYYELGSDVHCECWLQRQYWSCTGTIINNHLLQLEEEVKEEEVDTIFEALEQEQEEDHEEEEVTSITTITSTTQDQEEEEEVVTSITTIITSTTPITTATEEFAEIQQEKEEEEVTSPSTITTTTITTEGDEIVGIVVVTTNDEVVGIVPVEDVVVKEEAETVGVAGPNPDTDTLVVVVEGEELEAEDSTTTTEGFAIIVVDEDPEQEEVVVAVEEQEEDVIPPATTTTEGSVTVSESEDKSDENKSGEHNSEKSKSESESKSKSKSKSKSEESESSEEDRVVDGTEVIDEKGCVSSEGYTWCASRRECLQPWVTFCELLAEISVEKEPAPKAVVAVDVAVAVEEEVEEVMITPPTTTTTEEEVVVSAVVEEGQEEETGAVVAVVAIEEEEEQEEVTILTTAEGTLVNPLTGEIVTNNEEVEKEDSTTTTTATTTTTTTTPTEAIDIAVEEEEVIDAVTVDVDDNKISNMTMTTSITLVEEVVIDSESKTAITIQQELQQELFCPVGIPLDGDSCDLGGYDFTICCYTDPTFIPGTVGTLMCTCADDFGVEEFTCVRGSHSHCT